MEIDEGLFEKGGLQTSDFLKTFCAVFAEGVKTFLAHDEIAEAEKKYQQRYENRSNTLGCKDHDGEPIHHICSQPVTLSFLFSSFVSPQIRMRPRAHTPVVALPSFTCDGTLACLHPSAGPP